MDRKTALVGCKNGHWIRTSGMQKLRLNARVQGDVMIQVAQRHGDSMEVKSLIFVGSGRHQLEEATWTAVNLADGPHIDALCLLESGV